MNIREYWKEINYTPVSNVLDLFDRADMEMKEEPAFFPFLCAKVINGAKDNYKVWTELIIVLNHKIWHWYKLDAAMGIMYDTLWKMMQEKFFEAFEDNKEALEYYYRVTD